LGLRIAKNGGFIGCSNYPECRFTRPLAVQANGGKDGPEEPLGPKVLGSDPASGEVISLRKGPYGFYLQIGEASDDQKPKRSALPRGMDPGSVTLAQALALLALPREVGKHPESGEVITAGLGRYGPYLKHDGKFVSLKGDDDVLTIGLNRAVIVLAEQKRGGAGKPLGAHPADGQTVTLLSGRYGPYVKHGRLNATLPKDLEPEAVTLERAVELLAAQAEKVKAKKGGGSGKAKGGKAGAKTRTQKKRAPEGARS
jgi:DNA topoisomerase-1